MGSKSGLDRLIGFGKGERALAVASAVVGRLYPDFPPFILKETAVVGAILSIRLFRDARASALLQHQVVLNTVHERVLSGDRSFLRDLFTRNSVFSSGAK